MDIGQVIQQTFLVIFEERITKYDTKKGRHPQKLQRLHEFVYHQIYIRYPILVFPMPKLTLVF
jgi:hypothetical protein